jgi:two-component system phosphate regulon sensor histidine kinase PhoR
MKRSKIQIILLLITLSSLVLLAGIQVVWLIKSARMQEAQFNHTVGMAMNRIIESLSNEKNICHEVNKCLMSGESGSCYLMMKNREEWKNIKTVIENDLKFFGINLDFEFDIVDINAEPSFSPGKATYLSNNLEKILEQSGYKLLIRFPGKRDFLIAQIGKVFVFSIILLVVITLSFIMIYRLYRREKQFSASIADFINNMTHEFKTPLTNISLANNMISKSDKVAGDSKLAFYSEIIRTEHSKLRERTDSLLRSSFQENGVITKKIIFDASAVVEESVNSFNIRAIENGGTIKLKKEGENFNIKGDPDQFRIVITNIIDNSLKYCTCAPEILAGIKSQGRHLIIEIEDNGPGIQPEFHNQVFEKYFRVPSGDVHRTDGFGLGLYHARQITIRMGGRIRISGRKAGGLKVTLEFPLVKIDEKGSKTV